MTVRELVEKNRSYRGYNENRRLTREELTALADCARLCPSSVNAQPFRYYLVWEKDQVDAVQALTRWARALPELELPHPGMRPTGFIVICQDRNIGPALPRYQKDVGIVAQTMLLAATEMGLGGCMIGNFSPEEVSGTLSLPDWLTPVLIVALGEPAERIVLTELPPDGDSRYYRDAADVHYVPKRRLEDVVLTRETTPIPYPRPD